MGKASVLLVLVCFAINFLTAFTADPIVVEFVEYAGIFYSDSEQISPPPNGTVVNNILIELKKVAATCLSSASDIKMRLLPGASVAARVAIAANYSANQTLPLLLSFWEEYQNASLSPAQKQAIFTDAQTQLKELLIQWQNLNSTFNKYVIAGLKAIQDDLFTCTALLGGFKGLCNLPSKADLLSAIQRDEANLKNCSTPYQCQIWKDALAADQDRLNARVGICDPLDNVTVALLTASDGSVAELGLLRNAAMIVRTQFLAAVAGVFATRFGTLIFKAFTITAIGEMQDCFKFAVDLALRLSPN